MRTAIVVLAIGEYWKGAECLFYTLRKYGGLPDEIDCIALGAKHGSLGQRILINQSYIWVPVNQKAFFHVANKFYALTLDYDRIILMDADMLCVGDCSLLWSDYIGALPFYAVRDIASVCYYQRAINEIGLDETRLFNAGTMVFNMSPPSGLSQAFLSNLLKEIADGTLKAYDGGDQGYLNHYFQKHGIETGFLPLEYNGATDIHFPQVPDHAKKIIHFTGRNANPWAPDAVAKSDRRWPWIQRWQQEFKECQFKTSHKIM